MPLNESNHILRLWRMAAWMMLAAQLCATPIPLMAAASSPPAGSTQTRTAPVSFLYDPNYRRVIGMTDGTGDHSYTCYPYSATVPPAVTTGAGRLATETGPLANALIAYGYDELGRVNSQSVNGVANNGTSITYDGLGRTTGVTNPLGAFTYNYLNATNRLSSVAYPNGQRTVLSYFPNAGDQRLQEIKNLTPSGAILSKFDYTYNAEGNIQSWTQQTDANTPTIYDYQYDAADQLIAAIQKNTATQAVLHQYVYGYDLAANRTSEQIDNQINAATVNGLNQLTATQGGGPLQFSGTLSEPSTVTVNGTPAVVSGTSFTGSANVTPGTNVVAVAATNNSGKTTTHKYQVTATGSAPQAFSYDPEGNTTSDGAKTYEWDAENRMTAINYVGTPNRSEFTYDGLGRRVAIIEKTNGVVTSTKTFVFVGFRPVEERDASNNVTTRFFSEGEQIAGAAYFFTRDHLDSIREMTDATGVIHARYAYTPYGVAAKLSGDLDADFGFTGHFLHSMSGLILPLNRAYAANSGRWLSRDPIEENGGVNLYGYVGNGPVNGVDPFGLVNLSFFGPHDNLLDFSKDFNPVGFYSIGAHGSPLEISDDRVEADPPYGNRPGEGKKMTAKDLAAILNKPNSGYKKGTPIYMLSCSVGKGGDKSFAQQLSNLMGVEVRAANDIVWPRDDLKFPPNFPPDKEFYVAPRDPRDPIHADMKHQGQVIPFMPQKPQN